MTQHGSAMTRHGLCHYKRWQGCHVMAKNSSEGNKARTARYRAGLAVRGIRPVQLYAPEAAHALLRQAAGLMSRKQDPLEPRAALRQAGSANEVEKISRLEADGQGLVAELDAARAAEAAARAGLAGTEERLLALAAELEGVRNTDRRAEQARVAEATAALARAEAAERGREEAGRELAAVRAETQAAQGRELATQKHADALQGELERIRDRRGWRRVLLRLASI